MDRLNELKVKVKSLAEEARIIRKEEKKTVGYRRERLYLHRILDVRMEARASQIAYACLRGVHYEKVEPNPEKGYWWEQAIKRARKIALNFGPEFPWYGDTPYKEKRAVEEQHKKQVEEWFDGVLQRSKLCNVRQKTDVTAA